ncbi:MAG: MBL fold metallo-hydrolase [Pseudomonadota bacterium]
MAAKPDYLHYAFDSPPDHGERVTVAPGVDWLRMPLPFLLGHINVWLLSGADRATIVDTGLNSDQTKDLWRAIIGDTSVERIVVTHMHPDHVGCAGWLHRQFDAPLHMTRAEYLMCRVLVADTGKPAPEAGVTFYRGAGFSDEAIDQYIARFGGFGKAVASMPDSYVRMNDLDTLTINGDDWQIITTSGHCPEHAALFNAASNVVIAGDQLLPTISSNVSVWPTEPNGNPLKDWLDGCRRLQSLLPADVLVLPSHGKPFTGAHERLQALIDEHEQGLEKLMTLCETPRRAVDTFPALFKSRITDSNLIMATGEAIAHLNYLIADGDITCRRDNNGVDWYERQRV